MTTPIAYPGFFDLVVSLRKEPTTAEENLFKAFGEVILKRVIVPLSKSDADNFSQHLDEAVEEFTLLRLGLNLAIVGTLARDLDKEGTSYAEAMSEAAEDILREVENNRYFVTLLEPALVQAISAMLQLKMDAESLAFDLVARNGEATQSQVNEWLKPATQSDLCILAILSFGEGDVWLERDVARLIVRHGYVAARELHKSIGKHHRRSINGLKLTPPCLRLSHQTEENGSVIPKERRGGGDPLEAEAAERELFEDLAPARKQANRLLDRDEHAQG